MKDYRLYLFDFDNTLFNTRYGIEVMLADALPVIGVGYKPEDFPKYIGMNIDEMFDRYAKDPDTYDEYIGVIRRHVESDGYMRSRPFPEVPSVLRELQSRGKRIGIVSGKRRYKIVDLLTAEGLEDIPEIVVGWEETERHKPDPEPIALAASFFGMPKATTLYIGDSPNDSGAAMAFEIDVAIVNRHDGMSADGIPCTYEIGDLSELLLTDRFRACRGRKAP